MKKNLVEVCKLNKYFINLLNDDDKCKVIMNSDNSIADNIIDPSERVQISIIIKNPKDIVLIKNPTEFIQKLTVEEDYRCFKYLTNPSIDIQEYVIRQNSAYIRYIKNPCAKIKELSIKLNHKNIKYIENPTESLQYASVKENPYMLKYIKKPTAKIINYCYKEKGDYIKHYINFEHALSIINSLSDEVIVSIFNTFTILEYIKPQDFWEDRVKSIYFQCKL